MSLVSTQPLHLRLAASPAIVGVMRARLRCWLDQVGAGEETSFDLVTACSEAFKNAIEHPVSPSRAAIEVDASLLPTEVVVSIRDYGQWTEASSHDRPHRGYEVMCALADCIDVDRSQAGTVVTLRKDLPQR